MSIFKACDIRGVAGEDLTEDIVREIVRAVGVKLTGGQVVVGGDIRLSTSALKRVVVEELRDSGCRVLDIGTVATPVFYFAMKKVSADGGVMITASHNPAKYNGMKMVFQQQPITEEELSKIAEMTRQRECIRAQGTAERIQVLDDYWQVTGSFASPDRLHVVLDAGNGATSLIAPTLYRRLGYQVTELFCEPDGQFPNREPNPALAENLVKLGEVVRQTGAALGIAFDGDGDRVGFVDEQGRVIDNDKIMVLLARHYLAQGGGTIIYDAKCSMVVPEEIKKAGGRPVMARAGHTFSKAAFLRENALFAGEISGHFFFRELGYDDGMYAGLKVAEFISAHGPLSVLTAEIPDYELTPDIRVTYTGPDKEEILEVVAERLAKYQPNRIDGVRLEFEDGWGMIRSSVTEPLFTLRFEAKTRNRLQEIASILLKALPENIAEMVLAKMPYIS